MVVCLEVLEHLPDPIRYIKLISNLIKTNGVCYITESFDAVYPWFPTHLARYLIYAYKTPFLFLRENLKLNYYPNDYPYGRPMEFIKRQRVNFPEKMGLYLTREILLPALYFSIKRYIKKSLSVKRGA